MTYDAAVGYHGATPSSESLVRAAERIAERVGAGGRLLVHGAGRAVADARHVVVEFMHPVTVGNRALPAFEGVDGARPGDVTMSIAYGGGRPASGVDVVMTDTPIDRPGDGVVVELPTDAATAKVAAVTGYHVIWELVHRFLEADRAAGGDRPPAAGLYPMLYASDDATADPTSRAEIRVAAIRSADAKLAESAEVRTRAIEANRDVLAAIVDLVDRAGSIFTFGNGGSSTDAGDAATVLGPRARSLAHDVATLTALANDVSFDVVFARQLATVGAPGDVAIAFSTSGDSKNLIDAAVAAKRVGLATVGFAGYDGGGMAASDAFDVVAVVPSDSVHRIQEAQSELVARVARGLAARAAATGHP